MKPDEYEYDLMATRRKDPDYEQVSGYVHKDLALKFRIICMTERLTQSDALEEALKFWTEFKNTEGNRPTPISSPDRSEAPVTQISAPPSEPDRPAPAENTTPPATKAKRGKVNKEAS